ncbi:sucrose-phosphate phosphatase [Tumidithrix helvetica PCC 7403]|uniref:sucrose-phosphate phosphatase n=1 Tax=Tumidithrix helvetica TaxID=3457545 RepID=UPI003C8D9DA6
MTPFLIVTDLDATLVGNRASLQEFNMFFMEHRKTYGSKLVYATGRSLKLYQDLESEVDLLPPDRLITSVGSEIYTADKQMDRNWANHLSKDWDVEIVRQIASEYEQLKPQPNSEQGLFKVSFHLKPQDKAILEDLKQELKAQNIKAQVIYSSNKDVDVLPERSGKGKALSYVREALGVPCDRTVACGDSGNDITLFTENTFGIIVGNPKPELKEWYEANKRSNVYLARKTCAAGILEGLSHFGWMNV